MANIDFDTSELETKIAELLIKVAANSKKALNDIATEALRLSQMEVPIHTVAGEPGANLQNSGHVDDSDPEDVLVGYNTVYAAYQHEGMRRDGTYVVSHYTNARSKKKYLEDPIRKNLDVFKKYYSKLLS